ncbi:hypothetical protein K501DRAFT_195375 [Backusella circina FSU 941]|nr:hypothetical protein K501DRAFT_195375 [Backusella circina FSU 941]
MASPIYYIRFFKPPPTQCKVGQPFTIVWTIESDLGDQSYWEAIPITLSLRGSTQLGLRIHDAKTKKNTPKNGPYAQAASMQQETQLVFDPFQGGGMVTKIVIEPMVGKTVPVGSPMEIQLEMSLSKSARKQSHTVWKDAFQFESPSQELIWIIPAWSIPLDTMVVKQRHGEPESGDQAERWLGNGSSCIKIREDAVQSIARHIWDCGLGMCDYLNQLVHQEKTDFNHNVILELGSGTGLVGIYAAQLLSPKEVYLTDLEDALEIMQQNADLVQDKKCKIIVNELAWGPDADPLYDNVDLVLLTDVLYNQSSHDVLLDTLNWLLKPATKALLAYKERNPDERVFFTKVKERGFECKPVNNDQNVLWEFYWIEKA